MEHYASGLPVVEILDEKASSENETDSETAQQIKHLIDTRVRPLLQWMAVILPFHHMRMA